jgi:putative membrane protein
MFLGIVVGVFGITYLFENFPEPLWGFFFGLILASCIYVGRKVDKWKLINISMLIVGAIVAYGITIISPSSGDTSAWYVFLSGMVAICALILPGISGSFILLLMGMYTVIIPTIKSFLVSPNLQSAGIIAVFAMGCLTGLVGFSRVMNFLFNKYPSITLSLLVGFMLGSLNKIWPWRNVSEILDKRTFNLVEVTNIEQLNNYKIGGYKVISEINVLPGEYWMGTSKLWITLVSLLFGFCLLFIFDSMARKIQSL